MSYRKRYKYRRGGREGVNITRKEDNIFCCVVCVFLHVRECDPVCIFLPNFLYHDMVYNTIDNMN